MLDLWRQYYPGYDEGLRALPPEMREEHFQRVYIAWSCERLAWELANAESSRWPFRNRFWLEHMVYMGMPVWTIAEQSRVPRIVVRYYMLRYGLVEAHSVRDKLSWLLGVREDALCLHNDNRMMPQIEEQVRANDRIFVRPTGNKLFIPAEHLYAEQRS